MEDFIQAIEGAEKKLEEAEALIAQFSEGEVTDLTDRASSFSERLLQNKASLLAKKEHLLGQLLRLLPHFAKLYPKEGLRFVLPQEETDVSVFLERENRFNIIGIGPMQRMPKYFRLEEDHPTNSYKKLASSIVFWPFAKALLEFYISSIDDVSKTSSADAVELSAIIADLQALKP